MEGLERLGGEVDGEQLESYAKRGMCSVKI